MEIIMDVKIIKVSNPILGIKSYQMRIEFNQTFNDSVFERQLIEDFDLEWKKIGVHYLWHIGENFADGFFDDFNGLKISISEIIENSKITIEKYKDKILSITFKDIN
jgi:hypothetical protein